MSLINDALKRAKQTQPANPAAEGPALQPIEAPILRGGSRNQPDYWLPISIGIILLLSGLFFWQWYHAKEVRARTVITSYEEAFLANKAAAAATPAPAPAANWAHPAAINASVPAVIETPAPAPVAAPKPATITYRLQSIFYQTKNPSAMINGKTVLVGSHLNDLLITSIGKDSVTVFAGSTGKNYTLVLR